MGRIWMKLYIGWHESDWLSVLAPESRLSWILLLERVKTHGDGGRIKKSNYEDLARRWNVGVENIRMMVKAGVIHGAIEEDETEWFITGWPEYQEDHTNAERQQRYRDRKKRNETGSNNEALRNDRNVTGRGEERRIEEIPPKSPKGDAEWLEFLAVYPARKGDLGKAKGHEKFKLLAKNGTDIQSVVAGAKRYADHLRKTEKLGSEYVKQIPTFLNGRIWEEDFGAGNYGSAKKVRSLDEVHVV